MHLKRLTAVTVVLLLVAAVWANPTPLGTVSSSRAATVRGTDLAPGATIFDGDAIEVGPQGSVWIALRGGGQVHVFENSSVRLTKATDSIQLTIDRGNAQTNAQVTVINNTAAPNKQVSADKDKDKDKDKDGDCDVSVHKKHKEPKDHCDDDRN